ncbi:thioesterase family protein [Sphingomonas sp. RT2P30]|uniref:acyl-CoA thioesterase n=1 Tax=Parasphingomonas halimpatiens TaxID=3096162 RepID=UPI002FC70753
MPAEKPVPVRSQRAEVPSADEFRFWLPARTRNRDTDQFGHVNHAAMATLLEESRIALIFAPELEVETQGIDLLVASLSMHFHKELRAPGDIRIGARVTRIGSSSLDIRQAIFAGATCFASAEAVCVFLGHETRLPAPVSDTVRKHLLGTS